MTRFSLFPPGILKPSAHQLPPVSPAEAPDDTEKVQCLIHDTRFPLIFVEGLAKFPILFSYDTHTLIYTVGENRMLSFSGFYPLKKAPPSASGQAFSLFRSSHTPPYIVFSGKSPCPKAPPVKGLPVEGISSTFRVGAIP